MITVKEIAHKDLPLLGGLQNWNPKFKHYSIEQIKEEIKINSIGYMAFYNYALFVRETSTIHFYRSIN